MDVCGDIKALVRLATPQLSNNNRELDVDAIVFMAAVYCVVCLCSAVLFMGALSIGGVCRPLGGRKEEEGESAQELVHVRTSSFAEFLQERSCYIMMCRPWLPNGSIPRTTRHSQRRQQHSR